MRSRALKLITMGLLSVSVFLPCVFSQGLDGTSSGMRQGLEKSIFLDLRDINVVDVFKFLAVQGQLNIVTSKNVQGRSTLLLRDVKIMDALDILVISNQLAYEIKGDIIYIMTEDEYALAYGKPFNDKKKIAIRNLKTAKPSYVMTALQAAESAIGKVIIDEDTGTVVMIDTAEKLKQMQGILDEVEGQLETKVIELQYGTAKDVEAQLKPQIEAKGVGSVFADERSNQIVISAYPGRMSELEKLVKALDKKTRGVLIEARILQLTLNPKYDFGINWEKTFNRATWSDLNLTNSFPIDSNVSTAANIGSVGKIGIGDLTQYGIEGELKMVREIENTKVLASPRLMMLDRQEGKINIGDRIPYVVTTSTGTGNNVSVSEDIRFIDVGIILSVTPVINENGFITMKIRPEISSRTGTLVTPTDNEIPLVNTTYVESTVIIKDNRTVILGGLIRDEQTELNRGIPYLMDIPLLGHLFKSRNESIRKTEIIILITPRIVTGADDVMDEPPALKTSSAVKVSGPFQIKTFGADAEALNPVVVNVDLSGMHGGVEGKAV